MRSIEDVESALKEVEILTWENMNKVEEKKYEWKDKWTKFYKEQNL